MMIEVKAFIIWNAPLLSASFINSAMLESMQLDYHARLNKGCLLYCTSSPLNISNFSGSVTKDTLVDSKKKNAESKTQAAASEWKQMI